jgi:hypothetical protein
MKNVILISLVLGLIWFPSMGFSDCQSEKNCSTNISAMATGGNSATGAISNTNIAYGGSGGIGTGGNATVGAITNTANGGMGGMGVGYGGSASIGAVTNTNNNTAKIGNITNTNRNVNKNTNTNTNKNSNVNKNTNNVTATGGKGGNATATGGSATGGSATSGNSSATNDGNSVSFKSGNTYAFGAPSLSPATGSDSVQLFSVFGGVGISSTEDFVKAGTVVDAVMRLSERGLLSQDDAKVVAKFAVKDLVDASKPKRLLGILWKTRGRHLMNLFGLLATDSWRN